jgi:Mg2+-importing ATPase
LRLAALWIGDEFMATSSPKTLWLKRGLSLLALAVVLYLFWPLLGELRAAAHLFLQARWEWFPLILAIQVVSYGLLAWLNELALRPFPGQRLGLGRMAALLTSMAFIEVAIPSAGASGLVLRARLLGKHGYTAEASTFTLAVESFFLGLVWVGIALVGLFYLLWDDTLQGWQAGLLLSGVLPLAVGGWRFWQVLNDAQRSQLWLDRFARAWEGWRAAGFPLLRRLPSLDLERLKERLSQFHASLEQFRQVPVWQFLLAALGRVLLDIATLGACFLFFGHPLSPGVLLIGYSLILTTSALAALPGGLGMADLSIPGIFLKLGVSGAAAISAGLLYRLIAFWLVRFIGFLSWQFLEGRP